MCCVESMKSFPYPTAEWDYDYRHFLFYSEKTGWVRGRCIKSLVADQYTEFNFTYDRDAYELFPSHWAELPEKPETEKERALKPIFEEAVAEGVPPYVIRSAVEEWRQRQNSGHP